MSRPRKPTEITRVTLDLQAREILGPELDAPAHSWRVVQLVLPDSPRFGLSIDEPTARDIAQTRGYLMPWIASDTTLKFMLQPHQRLYGMIVAEGGMGFASMITEYCEAE